MLEGIRQFYLAIKKEEWKPDTLCDLYETLTVTQAIIYCNTRRKVDFLSDQMTKRDFIVSTMHAKLDQKEHDLIMREFRSGSSRVLITACSIDDPSIMQKGWLFGYLPITRAVIALEATDGILVAPVAMLLSGMRILRPILISTVHFSDAGDKCSHTALTLRGINHGKLNGRLTAAIDIGPACSEDFTVFTVYAKLD